MSATASATGRIGRRLSLVAASTLALLATAFVFAPVPGRTGPEIRAVEVSFQNAIRRARPATVGCVPHGAPLALAGFSSGVIISSDGLVLSDGDAGLRWEAGGGNSGRRFLSDVDVRVPRPEGGYRAYRARVLHRDRDADTSLLRILQPPARGLPFVEVGRSDTLEVGDFAFALGTAFDEESRSPPAMTAGVVASAEPAPRGSPTGRHHLLYVSAAVNQGVNGGPLVDLAGRLVGTVSSYVDPAADAVHQFLGKVVPIDRIRAVHAAYPQARAALAARRSRPSGDDAAFALQTVFRAAAVRAHPGLVALEVRRERAVECVFPLQGRATRVPRYQGPFSGILIDPEGWIVTSLYNLTNVCELSEPLWRTPPGAGFDEGLSAVGDVTAHLSDGRSLPARITGYDPRLGVALLRVDMPEASGPALPPWTPAPAIAFEEGRFVLAVGNPFGATRRDRPLLTLGILSKEHAPDAAAAWRGQWQTDAPIMDTNCGGAAVDLEGRLLGLLTIWHPARHGRSSGVGFVVPWERIRQALPAMRAGEVPLRGFLGVSFEPGSTPIVSEVIAGSAAEEAGLQVGDVVHRIGPTDTPLVDDVVTAVRYHYANEEVAVVVQRGGALQMIRVRLGAR